MSEQTEKKQVLTGKSNYMGWSKVMKSTLATKKLIIKNVVQDGKAEEAANLSMTSVSLKIAGDLPDDEGPIVMLNWL